MKKVIFAPLLVALLMGTLGCSGQLTTREKSAAIGTVSGAAVGAIIGSAVGSPGTGAGIGSAVGLAAGALIGDRMQRGKEQETEQQKELEENQTAVKRQQQEIEELKQDW